MTLRTSNLFLTWQLIVMFSVLIWGRGLGGEAAQVSSLELNSVLKPTDSISLLSGNRIFAAGFIPAGTGAYAFGIWYAAIPDSTVVWLANRDHVVDRNSSLALTQKGNMVLSTSDGTVVWATNTSDKGVNKAVLQENGSLVLLESSGGSPVWQSFDHPTDTLLPMQRFLRDIALVSDKSENTYASGNYKLSFNSNNQLSLAYTGEAVAAPDKYWVDVDSVDQSQQYGVIGGGGDLIIANAGMNTTGGIVISDGLNFMTSDFGEAHLRRLTLGSDGNLRVYSWSQNSSRWTIVWRAIQQQCKIYGMCGPNALCVDKLDDTHTCICPPGFHPKSSTDISLSLGCEPNIVLMNCTSTQVQNSTSYKFISLEFVNFQGHDLLPLSSATLNQCETACRNNCSCVGFYYKYSQVSWKALGSQNCFLKAKLLNGYQSPDADRMFIKVSALESAQSDINSSNSMNLICLPAVHLNYPKLVYGYQEVVRVVSVSSSILVLEIIIGAAAAYFLMAKYVILRDSRRYGLEILSGRPKKFTYAELQAATDNFSEVLGKGGYGTVYKGYLPDQTPVAVKRIDRMSEGEEEFWAEVTIICRIHHLNLVRMRGFCAQGEHRLLVYEYVPNGSLDTHLFSATCTLDWKKRYQIALGTSRGIAYLHEECLEWILHCDIKPQNVLLDDNFCPKVSDFGVSKLVDREKALSVSTIRGTRGYLAPEWVEFNQPITAKADVYSFGMVLLEIISGRKNFEFTASAMDDEEGLKTPASIVLIIYTFIAVWFVGGLTAFHIYLISTNQTTYENFRYRYDNKENPYHRGLVQNFIEIFFTKTSPSKNNFRAKVTHESPDYNFFVSRLETDTLDTNMGKGGGDLEIGGKPSWPSLGIETSEDLEDLQGDALEGIDTRSGIHPRRSSWGRKSGSWEITPDIIALAAGVGGEVSRANGVNTPGNR